MLISTPFVGISTGDPSGIGPEVALKALLRVDWRRLRCRPLLVGSLAVLEEAMDRFGVHPSVRVIRSPKEMGSNDADMLLLDLPVITPRQFRYGEVNPVCASAAVAYVTKLTNLALANQIVAVACAPVSKQAQLMSGARYGGHAELIGDLCGSSNFGMLCISDDLAVMSVTGHIPLCEVPARITADLILKKVRLATSTYLDLRGAKPRIAVCALDPHRGEGGWLGRTDTDIVGPACAWARREGFDVDDPVSADAVFRPYVLRRYDLVLGMYHDQTKVAVAALDSDRFVALLAGVPIVRTTTTHGAALDIAGRGCASEANMVLIIERAAEIALGRESLGERSNCGSGRALQEVS